MDLLGWGTTTLPGCWRSRDPPKFLPTKNWVLGEQPKLEYTWNLFVLYFWASTLQNKAFSNRNKGHLGSRYIYSYPKIFNDRNHRGFPRCFFALNFGSLRNFRYPNRSIISSFLTISSKKPQDLRPSYFETPPFFTHLQVGTSPRIWVVPLLRNSPLSSSSLHLWN